MARSILLGWLGAVALFTGLGARRALAPWPAAPPELPPFSAEAAGPGAPARLTLDSLRGRVWIANFVFTRCSGPCPLLGADMARLGRELPPGTRRVSFTVDPEHDTPSLLADYAERLGADAGWTFARLPNEQLYRLMYEGFKLPLAKNTGAEPGAAVTHSGRFALVDRRGRLRGLYARESLGELVSRARRLSEEAP